MDTVTLPSDAPAWWSTLVISAYAVTQVVKVWLKGRPGWNVWVPRVIATLTAIGGAIAMLPLGAEWWFRGLQGLVAGVTTWLGTDAAGWLERKSNDKRDAKRRAGIYLLVMALFPLAGCGGLEVERPFDFNRANGYVESNAFHHRVMANGSADLWLNVGRLEFLAYLDVDVRRVNEAELQDALDVVTRSLRGEAFPDGTVEAALELLAADPVWEWTLVVQVGVRYSDTFTALIELQRERSGTLLLCGRYGQGTDLRRLCYPVRMGDEPPGETVDGEFTAAVE